MCEIKIEKGELRVKMRFSDRPLQIVKLDEITGMTIAEDPTSLALAVLFGGISGLCFIYVPVLGAFLAFLTLLIFWQYLNRGRVTLIHARSHTVVIRGKHPEIWEMIKKARKG